MDHTRSRQPFLFIGNHPCLDFINTEMILEGRRTDLLETTTDLIDWFKQTSLFDQEDKRGVRLNQAEEEMLLRDARILRTKLRKMAEEIVAGKTVPPSIIEALNQLLSQRPGYSQLIRTHGRYERIFTSSTQGHVRLLAILAEAASDLLSTATLALIRKCRNDACILYYYDTTKNHARQWCSMQLCGNRIKVASHYERKRLAKT